MWMWELDCKEIQPVHPKGNQSWVFIGRSDVEVETPIFCHLMQKTDWLENILMLVKFGGLRRKGRQRMRWLGGITNSMDMSLSSFQELVVDRGLVWCIPWGCKELDTTEKLKVSQVKSLSCVRLLATPWIAAHQAPLPMGFSRQEYWSGVPLPSLWTTELNWLYTLLASECSTANLFSGVNSGTNLKK